MKTKKTEMLKFINYEIEIQTHIVNHWLYLLNGDIEKDIQNNAKAFFEEKQRIKLNRVGYYTGIVATFFNKEKQLEEMQVKAKKLGKLRLKRELDRATKKLQLLEDIKIKINQ